MITIKICGGLGNQMFQYAFIKALSLRNNKNFVLDNSRCGKYDRPYRLNIFNIDEKIANGKEIPCYEKLGSRNNILNTIYDTIKRFGWLLNKKHFKERKTTPIDKFFGLEDKNFDGVLEGMRGIKSGYIEGIFQSEKYFIDFKNVILNDLTFKSGISEKTKECENVIINSESVGVHIRRGDYLQKYRLKRLGMCDISYYKKAIEVINNKCKQPKFFFFSDDIVWCKDNFKNNNYYFVDWNKGDDDWQDMYLLHKCKNNIIGNSTFAWRGAYLNKNPQKIVICPNKRNIANDVSLQYIIPESEKWIKC